MSNAPACIVIDNFLTHDDHTALLAHALMSESDFTPTSIGSEPKSVVALDWRLSWKCQTGLGEAEQRISRTFVAAMPQIAAAIGMRPFALEKVEIELIAHRNGSFFNPHIDTLVDAKPNQVRSDRAISIVYYLHNKPRGFSGGELVLYPLSVGEAKVIKPRDNRLVAFVSFLPHEVKPVAIPHGNAFRDARFAVNCWLYRARQPAKVAQ